MLCFRKRRSEQDSVSLYSIKENDSYLRTANVENVPSLQSHMFWDSCSSPIWDNMPFPKLLLVGVFADLVYFSFA